MKRRIAFLLSGALVATVITVLAPTAPASAHTGVCTGQGVANTGAGLLYPGLPTATSTGATNTVTVNMAPTTTTFAFAFGVAGACVPDKPGGLTATGMVSGWCGLSSGEGVTGDGHRFAWVGLGSMLAITGELVGGVNATPDVTNNESCTTGADQFLVTGAVVLTHCTVTKSKLKNQTTIPTTQFLTGTAPSVHTTIIGGTWSTWHKECA